MINGLCQDYLGCATWTGANKESCRTPDSVQGTENNPCPESSTDPNHLPGNDGQIGTCGNHEEGGYGLERSGAGEPHHRDHDDPGSPMGPGAKEAPANCDWKATDGSESNAGAARATLSQGGGHREVPRSSQHEHRDQSGHPVENANQPETWQQYAHDPGSTPAERNLAICPMPAQTLESEKIRACQTHRAEFAEGIQRPQIQAALLTMKLTNPSNQCWVNGSVQAWLWNTFQAKDVEWEDFGTGETKVSTLFTCNSASGVDLLQCGFNHKDWSGGHQHDSAEYVTDLLEHYRPPRYHHGWEKRVMIGATGDILERNERRAPVVLGLGEKTTNLQTLVANWSSAENAVAAFTCASTFKVFHLDRVYHDSRGELIKSRTKLELEDVLLIPSFVDGSTTSYEYMSYTPMAVVFHSGMAQNGHFQAGLRGGCDEWLLTDDNRIPVKYPNLLDEIAGDLVQVWLVRSDQMGTIAPKAPDNNLTELVRQISTHMMLRQERELYRNQQLKDLLRTRCILCGQWAFRFRDLLQHLMEHHPNATVKWNHYKWLLAETPYTPCRWCSAWKAEDHECLSCLQAVIAMENFVDPYDAPTEEHEDLPMLPVHATAHGEGSSLADFLNSTLAAPPNSPNDALGAAWGMAPSGLRGTSAASAAPPTMAGGAADEDATANSRSSENAGGFLDWLRAAGNGDTQAALDQVAFEAAMPDTDDPLSDFSD